MSLKSINEAFDRQFNSINDRKNEEFEVLESLSALLRNLNEAEMSDEDRRESDLIRSAYNKIQKRVNARLTPEEQAVLDKYGIKRGHDKNLVQDNDTGYYDSIVVNNREDDYSHGKEIGRRYYPDDSNWRNSYVLKTKDQDKINYADRARKRPGRLANRTYDTVEYMSGWDKRDGYAVDDQVIVDYNMKDGNKSNRGYSQNAAINSQSQSKMNKMRGALDARYQAQSKLDNAKAEYDKRKAGYDADYMKRMQAAEREYDTRMRWAKDKFDRDSDPSSRDKAQADIDALLKRKKTEAVDLSDKKGSMTKILSDNDSWKNETTVQGVYKKVKSILDDNGFNTEASKRLLNNIARQRFYDKALETVYNSILAGSNLSTKRGISKDKNESLEEDWSPHDFYSDIYNALSDVMYKWHSAGYDLDSNQVDDAYEWFSIHFWEDEGFED